MTRRLTRIDNFRGSSPQYIAYLESQIVQLRNQLRPTTSQQQGSVSRLPLEPDLQSQFGTQEPQVLPQRTKSNDDYEVAVWQPGVVESLPSRMNSFFRDIPVSEEHWKYKRQLLELTTPDGLFRAFDDLMLLSPEWDIGEHPFTNSLQGSLSQYGRRLGLITRKVHRQQRMATFCRLIFVAACSVAVDTKHPSSMVDDAMRLCLASESSAKTLGRYRRAALFLIQQMDRLYSGLSHRSFELFLHGGACVTMFEPLIGKPEAQEVFQERILMSNSAIEWQASLPFHVPLLVWLNFNHIWDFDTVCRALQSNLFCTADADVFRTIYLNRELPVNGDPLGSAEQPCLPDPLICRSSEQLFSRLPIPMPYDSPIFVSIQRGDLALTRMLCQESPSLIDAVDPYGLGLLYYAGYYCWRSCGIKQAIAMCEALVHGGVRQDWLDEKGSVPVFTIIDALLAECVAEGSHFANNLSYISRVFGQRVQDLCETYYTSRQFTEVHRIMLFQGQSALRDYFILASEQDLPASVDRPDASGRSALAWAVEYGLLHCVKTLLSAGADPNQRVGLPGTETSLLHSALAGPPTGKTEIVYLDISAALINAGADVNATDAEGWTPLHIAASWGSHRGVNSLANSSLVDWGAVTQEGLLASQLAMCTADDTLISLLQTFENNVASRS